MRSTVIGIRDRAELFLARSVPYTQLDTISIHMNGLDLEVDTNRGVEVGIEATVHIFRENTRFAHIAVANE